MNARWTLPLGLALLLAGSAAAQQSTSPAADDQRAGELNGPACVKLNLQEANAALDRANQLYEKSDYVGAHKALAQIVDFSARATACALSAPRTQKRAEIELRGLLRRMNNLERTLEAEEQPAVAHAIHEVDQQHDRLMQQIFGAAAGRTEKPR